MAEAGVKNLVTGAWFGLFAPKGTPPEVVARMNKAVTDAVNSPTMRKKFLLQGAEPMQYTPESFGKFVVAEHQAWRPIVKASGARID
jgi:tripartite-type tricarboxylate transporter receptor subunit TctC